MLLKRVCSSTAWVRVFVFVCVHSLPQILHTECVLRCAERGASHALVSAPRASQQSLLCVCACMRVCGARCNKNWPVSVRVCVHVHSWASGHKHIHAHMVIAVTRTQHRVQGCACRYWLLTRMLRVCVRVQSALFDISSLLVCICLYICTCTYITSMRKELFSKTSESSFMRVCWKASRVGKRLSPYVSAGCVIMAVHLIFIKV